MKLDHAIQLSHMKLIHLVYKAKEITLTFQLKSANCFWLYVLILLLLFHQNVWFDFCKFHWLPYSQVWRRGLGQYQKTFKYWKCYICCTSGKLGTWTILWIYLIYVTIFWLGIPWTIARKSSKEDFFNIGSKGFGVFRRNGSFLCRICWRFWIWRRVGTLGTSIERFLERIRQFARIFEILLPKIESTILLLW